MENCACDVRPVSTDVPPEFELWSRLEADTRSDGGVGVPEPASGAPVVTGADGLDADRSSAGAGRVGVSCCGDNSGPLLAGAREPLALLTRCHAAASPLPEPLPDEPWVTAAAAALGDGLLPVLRVATVGCFAVGKSARRPDMGMSASTSAMLSAWSALSERCSSRGLSWGEPLPRLKRGERTAESVVSRVGGVTRCTGGCAACRGRASCGKEGCWSFRPACIERGARPAHGRASTAPDVTVAPAMLARALSSDAGARTSRRGVGCATGIAPDVVVTERLELARHDAGFGG